MKKENRETGYWGLWMILAVAMVIVIVISFSDDITLGNWTVKKAPYKEMLLRDKDSELLQAKADSIRLDSIRNQKMEVKTDSTPQSILLFGDSMTLNLAYRLAQYAKQNGHSFHAVNWDSSNTKTWASCDTLESFINRYNATFVFVNLGSNELLLRHPESRLDYIRGVIAKLKNLPYVWIGPPNWTEDFGINDLIERECRPGSFFRSAGIELARKKDHIHPTRGASVLWMDSIARWMPKSGHPILMDTPSDSIGKLNPNVTFLKALNK